MEKKNLIFTLDIGTRNVVGLLVEAKDEIFSIVDYEIMEHEERSMMDGQIHDVIKVAKVIQKIKENLEKRNGEFHEVSVAAAGRTLKTKRVQIEHSIKDKPFITKDDVLSFELMAVQEAQRQLVSEYSSELQNYYCVGYSVVNYYLDNEVIGSLIDQRGNFTQIDLIATFLPRVVVDSILSSLKRTNLSMNTLTLEPIAAINALIPTSMRKLNIALVDIGAGTSDIALTAEGTVTAYGMVPIAGDEVTEALSNTYLLDFNVAEEVKRKLLNQEEISFTDILGLEQTQSKTQIVNSIQKEIENLAQRITDKILELNINAPQAVMLIGGGSLTPLLPTKIAEKLEIPETRVAVRGIEAIQKLENKHQKIKGPEFVTPIGIAMAAINNPVKYLSVSVNERELHIFELKELLLGDVLLHAGFDIRRLHGKPGLGITIKVNGDTKFLSGTHGQPPTLRVNGKFANYDTKISDRDKIQIMPGENGKDASFLLKEVIEIIEPSMIRVNQEEHWIYPTYLINGEEKSLNTLIKDRDEITFSLTKTVKVILNDMGNFNLEPSIEYYLNDVKQTWNSYQIFINEKKGTLYDLISKNDEIRIEGYEESAPFITALIPEDELIPIYTNVNFNGKKVKIPSSNIEIIVNGKPVRSEQKISNGDKITIQKKNYATPVFSDIFKILNMDLMVPPGKATYHTLINGEKAEFFTPLKNGDELELIWE